MWVRISSFVNGQSDKMSDEMGFHIINIQIFDPYLRGAIEIFGSDGKWNTVSIRSGTLDWKGFAIFQHAYIPLADCYFHLVTGKKGQVAGKSKHWKWFPSFGLLSPWIKAQRRLWKPSWFDVPSNTYALHRMRHAATLMYMQLYGIIIEYLLLSFHRYNDGSVKLRNPNIELMDQDILYHLALGSGSHDLQEMFGDVKVSFYSINQLRMMNQLRITFSSIISRTLLDAH